jgi:hypothetical protein
MWPVQRQRERSSRRGRRIEIAEADRRFVLLGVRVRRITRGLRWWYKTGGGGAEGRGGEGGRFQVRVVSVERRERVESPSRRVEKLGDSRSSRGYE